MNKFGRNTWKMYTECPLTGNAIVNNYFLQIFTFYVPGIDEIAYLSGVNGY